MGLLLLRGQALQNLLPAARGQLEQRRGLKRIPCELEPADLGGARLAVLEMGVHGRAGGLVEVALDVFEQLDVVRVVPSHHSFDSPAAPTVPSLRASSVRPRKMRDFTVPSATPRTSAISLV